MFSIAPGVSRTVNNDAKKLAYRMNLIHFVCSQIFYFDVEKLDWDVYFNRYVIGLKKFLLKEDLANLPLAQSRIRR